MPSDGLMKSVSRWLGRAAKEGGSGGAASFLAYLYLKFVDLTSRIVWDGLPYSDALEASGKNFIYAFWHARQAALSFTHAGKPAVILVSRSKDGDIAVGTLHRFGLAAVRGSSSRGGWTALKTLLAAAQEGLRPGITPDGPRGPALQVKPGILYLAGRLEIPILPVACAMRRKLVFKSWDAFQLPLPFNRIAVAYGRPVVVGPEDHLREKAVELKSELDRAAARADALAAA